MTKPTVFISYSHADEAWKDRLVPHLGVLERQGLLDLWDDRRIGAGEDWYPEIQAAMERACVAILLVSANFLASGFIQGEEVPRLLQRRDEEGLRVFPVVVRPCAWKQVEWLARMQLRPRDARPLSAGDEHQIDADLTAIAEEIADIVERADREAASGDYVPLGPEKISLARLPSTDPVLFGREEEMATLDAAREIGTISRKELGTMSSFESGLESVSPPELIRLRHLADNIRQDLDLLKDYEDALRFAIDPRLRGGYRRDIEQLRKSAARYWQEYKELQVQITSELAPEMQDMVALLRQMDAKLDVLSEGQTEVLDELTSLRQILLARFDASERMIVSAVVEQLDQNQLATVEAMLDAIEGGFVPRDELEVTVNAVQQVLYEIRQDTAGPSDPVLTSAIERLSEVVDAPKLDVAHKLKVTVPIIPLILSYEAELALKSGVNLKTAWRQLLDRIRSE